MRRHNNGSTARARDTRPRYANVAAGLAGGAAGTASLEAVGYLDMAVRGRPPSEVPAEVVGRIAEAVGADLGPREANRRSGFGALLGQGGGVALGGCYGLLRRLGVRPPWPVAALLLTAGAMVMGNAPAAAAGATDPSTWSRTDWLSDLVPHLAYGVVTALTVELVDRATG